MLSILFFVFVFTSLSLWVMLWFRNRELKLGKLSLPSSDTPILPVITIPKLANVINRETIIALYEHAWFHLYAFATSLFLQIKRAPKPRLVQKAIDIVKGRNTIAIKREVDSTFIRTIVEHKEKMRESRNGNGISSI